jgi:hypothetical protein
MTAPYFSDNGMPGSQSAISALLQHLTQPPAPPQMPGVQAPVASGSPVPAPPGQVTLHGITMPAPQAAPITPLPSKPGLVDRIKSHLQDAINPVPGGYAGLLSSKEIEGARPGLLQSLIGTPDAPSTSQRYRSNLDHILELKNYAQSVADQQTGRERANAIQSVRVKAGEMFGAKPGETPQQSAQRLIQHGLYLMGQGDEEGGAKMLSAVGQLSKVLEGPETKAPVIGSPEWKAAEEFKASLAAKYRTDPTQIITANDKDGNPHFYRIPKSGGAPEMLPDIAPTPKAATGGAQNAAAEALLRSSVSEMGNADKFMREYEEGLKTGKYSINGVAQFLGGLGNAFTHDDPASRAIQNSALTALNKVNPDLARYIRRGLSFAEGEAGISKRPSDFRTKMATFLSTAASGASPDMINDIQGRRASILTPLHDVVSKMVAPSGGAAPAAPSVKREITKDQANFLRTVKKMSQADIDAAYTVKP